MFDAQILMGESSVFSPWMPRGGDNVRMTLDVIQVSNADIEVQLFTKKKEDAGDGTNADSAGSPISITASAAGRTTVEWLSRGTVGLKDLVRFKFIVTNDGDPPNFVMFRMLRPQWFDSVATAT